MSGQYTPDAILGRLATPEECEQCEANPPKSPCEQRFGPSNFVLCSLMQRLRLSVGLLKRPSPMRRHLLNATEKLPVQCGHGKWSRNMDY